MFEANLKRLVDEVGDAHGAAVLNLHGLVIEAVDGAGKSVDSDSAASEYALIFKQLLSVSEAVEMGEVTDFTIVADHRKTLIRVLSPEYVVALTVGASRLTGRSRFYLRVAAPDLSREL